MRLTSKASLFSALLAAGLVVILLAVSLYSFRLFSILSAEEHARSSAEIIRVGLTEQMVNGVIDQRGNFLKRLAEIEGLLEARVVRSPKVSDQFGPGAENEQSRDEIEQQVLATGRPVFKVIDQGMEPLFRSTIPYIADSKGSPNCLHCHQVNDGDVLGAVTITIAIGHLKQSALLTVGAITAVVALFTIAILFAVGRLMRPLAHTARDIQLAVEEALDGNFRERIKIRTRDEIGQIASNFNQLTVFLEKGLGSIRDNVAQLIQCKPSDNANLVTNTMEMVDGLVDAAHFKQAIEEDETKIEVYQRLAKVLEDEFQVKHYSLYEVTNSKNRMVPVVVDGQPDTGCCSWCDANIMVRSEACRARRTGHIIDSVETPGLCNAFKPDEDDENLQYICVPIIQSGSVGSVVQLVADPPKARDLHERITLLNVYLREAAPVIEAKRLMDTLRESTLRDAMTGLQNRRFLEEYADTIIAGTNRRKSALTIMMLDLDYFKKVNDTYGHDAGDTVIKTLAKIMRNSVRASDLVIRYGGEEFMIILQDSSPEAALPVAEKIRETVENTKISISGTQLQKTISIGVAGFPGDSETFWQTVKFADVALYNAKESGRNRVVRFTADMWEEKEEY